MKQDITNTGQTNARRRLIRGAFAAPAVLTLYSGSAVAGSVSCLSQQLTAPITNPPFPGDGTYVQVVLWKLASGSSDNSASFVRYRDLQALRPPGGSFLTSGKSQCVATGGNSVNVQLQNGSATYAVGSIYDTPTGMSQTTQYAAVRIDGNGKIVGVFLTTDGSGVRNTALYASCWTSIRPLMA